ncbi:hypothetical protein BPNPMPFG_002487 [Mesorhizobium sp. AR07]|uniref:hypothetical protein n=1 Tax=Mesorhizobium sp. AR07 TaxID=2865838 RepID=UPI00215FB519|nr:hypothetical protein [Mesorhizobium sp. AR07]UVK46779.1 hypothetical protein BPNPMPFG_002487 [Mesorhizobium sp. AR07]
MAELLLRELQHQILSKLSDGYPQKLNVSRTFGPQDNNALAVNLAYLDEHKLISVSWFDDVDKGKQPVTASITKNGLDFIANDGGLSAILGVVTVKLHKDTIRDLLISKVRETSASQSVKDHLIEQIKKLPAEALAKVTTAALDSGLARMPDMLTWLQHLLHRV